MGDSQSGCRILVLGAHPDDAEFHAGGFLARHAARGASIRAVSVTDGRCGHHEIAPPDLVRIRREEAREAGQVIGADFVTWDFPDGGLVADLGLRSAIIREIRSFEPDLVLTHRVWDYHPDHRAVGQAVQDASYLVTVPHIAADAPALRRDPVVAFMIDHFTRPIPFQADVLLDVSAELELIIRMLASHASQFFEWLPYHDGLLNSLPDSELQRIDWLRDWYLRVNAGRKTMLASELEYHVCGAAIAIEAFEISQYAGSLALDQRDRLFPDAKFR